MLVKDAGLTRKMVGNKVFQSYCAPLHGCRALLSTEPAFEMVSKTSSALGFPSETLRLPNLCFAVGERIKLMYIAALNSCSGLTPARN